jgi:hypothetical protein
MRQWLRSHLTYANVISTLCLFFVLGGGTAVALNGSNTVQSDDLGPGAQVKAPDVAANAVNSSNVVDGSVTSADIAANTIQGQDVRNPTLSGDDVLDNSLTGTQIDESTLDLPNVQERAKRIDYDQPDTDVTTREIGYQNGLYIFARCQDNPDHPGTTLMRMFVRSDFDASISSEWSNKQTAANANGDPVNNLSAPATRSQFLRLHVGDPPQPWLITNQGVLGFDAFSGVYNVMATSTYHSASAVISLNLEMIANGNTHRCQAYGTMLSATDAP